MQIHLVDKMMNLTKKRHAYSAIIINTYLHESGTAVVNIFHGFIYSIFLTAL